MVSEFPEFIRTLPKLDIRLEGVAGHLLQGASQQVAFVRFDQDTHVPTHSHRAQWEVVVAGHLTLHIGGQHQVYEAGQSFLIPEGVSHGADVAAGYRGIIIFDQPDRYRAKE
jgi:quercetin dioxygenase-like cupin family protein